jgi:hypothetical protein
VYGPGCLGGGWYEATGREIVGLGMFSSLNAAVGVPGLAGADLLLSYQAERELKLIMRSYALEQRGGAKELLARLTEQFAGPSPDILKTYATLMKQLSKPMDALMERLLAIGQLQVRKRV